MADVRVQATEFKQGGRTVYVLTPTVGQMLQIVPERVNPDVIQDTNRRLYTPHGKGFGEYLMNTREWLSGALMAGITEAAIKYSPTTHMATIYTDDLHTNVKLFDGQHRRFGIQYALEQAAEEIEILQARQVASEDPEGLKEQIKEWEEWADALVSETIPLLLYVESDIAALQQMYADISKVRVPDPITVSRFDKRDPFNAAALELAETHIALANKVDMERNTLGQKSDSLITLNQLASVLRILFGGIGGRIGRGVEYDASEIRARGEEFFDDVLAASETFRNVAEGRSKASEVRERGDLSLNVTMLKVEAAIWRELVIVREKPRDEVVEFVETLPHEPSADPDNIFVKSGLLPATTERKVTPMGRAQESRAAVSLAVAAFEAEKVLVEA